MNQQKFKGRFYLCFLKPVPGEHFELNQAHVGSSRSVSRSCGSVGVSASRGRSCSECPPESNRLRVSSSHLTLFPDAWKSVVDNPSPQFVNPIFVRNILRSLRVALQRKGTIGVSDAGEHVGEPDEFHCFPELYQNIRDNITGVQLDPKLVAKGRREEMKKGMKKGRNEERGKGESKNRCYNM